MGGVHTSITTLLITLNNMIPQQHPSTVLGTSHRLALFAMYSPSYTTKTPLGAATALRDVLALVITSEAGSLVTTSFCYTFRTPLLELGQSGKQQ
jgi:hypothetical protein